MVSLKKLHATQKHFTLSLSFQEACLVLYSSPFQKEVLLGHLSFGIRTSVRGGCSRRVAPTRLCLQLSSTARGGLEMCCFPCGFSDVLPLETVVPGAQFLFAVSPEACLLSSQVPRCLRTRRRRCLSPAWAAGASARLYRWLPLVFRLEDPWHVYDLVVWFWFILETAVLPG